MPLVPATSLMNITNTPVMVVMTHARNNTLDWAIWRLSDQFKLPLLNVCPRFMPHTCTLLLTYSHLLGTWWIIFYKLMPYMDPHTSFPKFQSHKYPYSHLVRLQMLTTPTHLRACNSHGFRPTTTFHVLTEKSSPSEMEALQGEVTVF